MVILCYNIFYNIKIEGDDLKNKKYIKVFTITVIPIVLLLGFVVGKELNSEDNSLYLLEQLLDESYEIINNITVNEGSEDESDLEEITEETKEEPSEKIKEDTTNSQEESVEDSLEENREEKDLDEEDKYEENDEQDIIEENVESEETRENEEEKDLDVKESTIREDRKLIALTFDDGPDKKITPMVLDELKKRDVKATFYLIGNNVEKNPEVVKRIHEEGHEIGGHSLNHIRFSVLSHEQIRWQVERTNHLIEEIIGHRPTTIRPPYGDMNSRVQSSIEQPIIMWSIDPQDWREEHRNPNFIGNRVVSSAHEGGVILLHDRYISTAQSVGLIVDSLLAQGYEFVTVSELFEFQEGEDNGSRIYRRLE